MVIEKVSERTSNESTDNSSSTDRSLHDGNDVSEFGFKGGVEVGRAGADGGETVRVGERCENSNLS